MGADSRGDVFPLLLPVSEFGQIEAVSFLKHLFLCSHVHIQVLQISSGSSPPLPPGQCTCLTMVNITNCLPFRSIQITKEMWVISDLDLNVADRGSTCRPNKVPHTEKILENIVAAYEGSEFQRIYKAVTIHYVHVTWLALLKYKCGGED
jgi:hypothetical protein